MGEDVEVGVGTGIAASCRSCSGLQQKDPQHNRLRGPEGLGTLGVERIPLLPWGG